VHQNAPCALSRAHSRCLTHPNHGPLHLCPLHASHLLVHVLGGATDTTQNPKQPALY